MFPHTQTHTPFASFTTVRHRDSQAEAKQEQEHAHEKERQAKTTEKKADPHAELGDFCVHTNTHAICLLCTSNSSLAVAFGLLLHCILL